MIAERTQIEQQIGRRPNHAYRNLRARLLSRGFTLRQWAIMHGININTMYSAFRPQQKRNGRKSQEIRAKFHEWIQSRRTKGKT